MPHIIIALYLLVGVLYAYEMKVSYARVLLWPYYFIRDITGILSLYAHTAHDVAEAADLHHWLNKKVRVADVAANKTSAYWSTLIGREGKVIASVGDDLITVWLDGEAIPNEQVLTTRFVLV